MRIKNSILQKINNVASRKRICDKLDIGDQMLYKHINTNKNNGALTKLNALIAISEETGEPVDSLCEELETGGQIYGPAQTFPIPR